MKFLFCLLAVISIQAHARDVVGNGSGRAERNILFAYTRLDSFIELCFQSDNCLLTQRQFDILSRIANTLSDEKLNRNQIQFASERQTPGFFKIDGEIRIAKTGDKIASSIFVNKDMLYTKNSQGYFDAFNIAQSVAMLIHELGHHHGDYTHAELDIVGEKVASILDMQIYTTPVIPWSDDVSSMAVNSNKLENKSNFYIYVFNEITDLTEMIYPLAVCPENTKPLGVMFYNLHWLKYPSASPEGDGSYKLQTHLALACKNAEGKAFQFNDSAVTIGFSVADQKMVPGTLNLLRLNSRISF